MVASSATAVCADDTHFHVNVWGKYIASSDVKDQPGDIDVAKVNVRIISNFHLNTIPVNMSVGGNHYLLSNKGPVEIPHSLKSRGLHIDTMFPLQSAQGPFYLGVLLNPSCQSGNTVSFMAESFRMRGGPYLAFKKSETFMLKAGAIYRSHYDSNVFPYVGLDYQITDRLQLDISSTESSLTPVLSYSLTKASTVFLEYEYELDEFKVDGGTHDEQDIQFTDQAFGVGLKHTFNKHFFHHQRRSSHKTKD